MQFVRLILFSFLSWSLLAEEDNQDFGMTSHNENEESYQFFLDPLYRTRLYAEVAVPVAKIRKRMGDSFEKDEVLIQFEDKVFIGLVMKAAAAVEKTKTEYEGKKQLYDDNIVSLFDLKEAEAQAAAAKSDLILATKNLKASKIRAPYKGRVVNLYAEEHELPVTGKELIEIVDDSILVAKLILPSSYIKKLQRGQIIPIHIKETGTTENAEITRISPVIEPSSSTIKVEAEIQNPDGRLNAGMIGEAFFSTKESASEN